MNSEKIYLGAGCFWCAEAVFQRVEGVVSVRSGYSGGTKANPTYEEVSTGMSGYVEVVEVEFIPEILSVQKLLDVFFEMHDPTSKDKQGNDEGSQYRSIIFVTSKEQFGDAFSKIQELNRNKYQGKIVTELKKFETFYIAEDYHQNFYNNNQNYPYCKVVIDPKIKKLLSEKMIK
jgi:peptide-methionine (S)-S-oxide reductase